MIVRKSAYLFAAQSRICFRFSGMLHDLKQWCKINVLFTFRFKEDHALKCPKCGRWNRATLEKCFYCGTPLPIADGQNANIWRSENSAGPKPPATVIYSVEGDGRTTIARPDERDLLAGEMQSLHTRRKRGEEQQQRIRRDSQINGYTPTSRGINMQARSARMYDALDDIGTQDPPADGASASPRQDPARYDDIEDAPAYQPVWNDNYRARPRAHGMSPRSMRHVSTFGLRRFLPYFAVVLLVGVIAFSAYYFIIKPARENKAPTLQEQVIISSSIINDMAAHTILIPAEEGSQIYIKELRKSYIVTGGYATVEVPDYQWYELDNTINTSTLDVTLTPYIKTSAGEQKLMETIHYTIDVPLSPITLVTPDTTYVEVSTSPYVIKFKVEQNSTVFINGEDYSSFVNTQDGYISYNATVQAIGENKFEIVVNCQYYRENSITLTLYRAPQDIPLELSSTLGSTSAQSLMTIRGTTIPGATITISSPYENLDTSSLNSTGDFSFQAKFDKIGTNTIVITAEKDGHSATLTKEVYYVPYSSTYTPKAWPMDATNYSEYLNNTAVRVARTQIYLCQGTIVEILSSKPQLALMDTDESESGERLVLLENMSSDTWVVGERYRVYADAYGVYDGKPRLVGRYTYDPLD